MRTRRRLALMLSIPLAFSLLIFAFYQRADHANIEVLDIQSLSNSVGTLVGLAKDLQVAEQGFLLTGDESYKTVYQQAAARVPEQIKVCRTLAREQPASLQQTTEKIIKHVNDQLMATSSVLNAQESQGFPQAMDVMKNGATRINADQLQEASDELFLYASKTRENALQGQSRLNDGAFLMFMVGTALMIVVLIWLYNSFLSYLQGREAAQAELLALNEDLERRIEERTRELQQSNEELQQFAYVASHDLQEPLRTITSFTQLLASRYRGRLDEDADEFITFIVSSSKRMTDLINGLLALVRLSKAGQPSRPAAIGKLVDDAATGLQASIRESGARIAHNDLPTLKVDAVQITQLFQNLISNAIKYRSVEPPLIKVSARRENVDWIFSVADNGQGFDPQFADRIFGLFQRLHGRDVDGTGMGLSIARKIVERHGGRIWAESTPGQGSTFLFTLPANLEPITQTPITASRLGRVTFK